MAAVSVLIVLAEVVIDVRFVVVIVVPVPLIVLDPAFFEVLISVLVANALLTPVCAKELAESLRSVKGKIVESFMFFVIVAVWTHRFLLLY